MARKHIKFLVCCILTFFLLTVHNNCSSEKVTVTAAGQYLISKNEKISEGEQLALKEALRSAIEKVAVRVTSYTKTVNSILEEDIIEMFASSVVKITDKQVRPVVEGDNVVIKVTITAVVDTKDIENWTPPDIEKQRKLESDNRELKEQISRDKRERLMSATGKQSGRSDELAAISINRIQPLIREQRYIEADKILTNTIKGGVEHPELYYQRGWLAMVTRQYGAAAADFDRAFKLSSDSRHLKARGDALFSLGKYDQAMQDYSRVISTNPDDAASWANRGACYWALGNAKQAVNNYDRASELGLEIAARIRYTLRGQYEVPSYKVKPTARKVLPLC